MSKYTMKTRDYEKDQLSKNVGHEILEYQWGLRKILFIYNF